MGKAFISQNRKIIQNNVISRLNKMGLMNKATANSPRDIVKEFSSSFARRAMADFAFTDVDGKYYVIDVKTHNLETSFNMPNLTSVGRLSRFY